MFYKCGGCRNFFWLTLLSFASCDSCNFIAVRCRKCGGQDVADKSLRSHTVWYRSKVSSKYGYRDIHRENYKPKNTSEVTPDIRRFVPRVKLLQLQ